VKVRKDVRFSTVPEWVIYHPELSDRAVRLYAALDRVADSNTGEAQVRRKVLGDRIGCDVRTVTRTLSELLAVGAVSIESGKAAGKSNRYVLHVLPRVGQARPTPGTASSHRWDSRDPQNESSRTKGKNERGSASPEDPPISLAEYRRLEASKDRHPSQGAAE
jgi:hypothetical protein